MAKWGARSNLEDKKMAQGNRNFSETADLGFVAEGPSLDAQTNWKQLHTNALLGLAFYINKL